MKSFLLIFLLGCSVLTTYGQTRKITGKVTDADNNSALPGVNILLKGTKVGVNTDTEGNFAMNVPTTGGTLVVSFIGMTTQEIAIGNQSTIEVKLKAKLSY